MNPIVENIECMQGVEGDIWVTTFEGKKLSLTTKTKPTWEIGDTFLHRLEVVKPEDGNRWYYTMPDGESIAPQKKPFKKQDKTYKADPAKMDSMELMNNKKVAVELYNHTVPAGSGEFDTSLWKEIFEVVKNTK